MPLYEYLCDACGHRFEKIQKFSDPPVEECPNCGKKQVHKLLSSPAIQFKGSGWYITDYARKGGGGSDAGKSESETKNSDAKSGESKTSESKPADSKTTPTSPAPSTSKDS